MLFVTGNYEIFTGPYAGTGASNDTYLELHTEDNFSVCPKLGFFYTKEGAKALVLLMAGKSEAALNAEFYYIITAKTQTTFSVYIAATVAAAGSYAAAVEALQAAGFTATVSLVSFVGSGGLAFPVSIKLGVASISSLIASGVCVIAGASLAAVALEAYRVFRADMQLYERVYYLTPDDIGDMLRDYGNEKCVEAKKTLTKELSKRKQNYEVVSIQYQRQGAVMSLSEEARGIIRNISRNGYHVGVLYNGLVHCNVHKFGLPLALWLNDFFSFGPFEVEPKKYQSMKIL